MYYCNICDKQYTKYSGLWNHQKKYHSTTETQNKSIKKDILCNYCNKQFTRPYGLNQHLKTCKSRSEVIEQSIETEHDKNNILDLVKNIVSRDQDLAESVLNLVTENFLEKQSNMLQSQNSSGNNNPVGNNNQINNPVNSHNHIINNNITISLGNENLSDVVSKNDQIKILKQKNDVLLEIIKLVHFSSKYPQFHNIAIQGDKAYQYNDIEKKFLETPKDIMLYDLIENRVNDIYDFNEENKLSLSKKTYSWIKCYTNMFNFETRIKNSIEKIEPVIEKESDKLITTNQIKL